MSNPKKNLIRIVHNPVVAKLANEEREIALKVYDVLSYTVQAAAYSQTGWDGLTSFFNMKTRTFPAGLVRLVKKRLERDGYKVYVKSKPAPAPRGEENPKVDNFPDDPRYNYQPEVMRRLVEYKNMIARIATGGGKSRCFKLCERRLALPTLFLTTRKSLMYQMKEGYKNMPDVKIGLVGDGHWSPVPDGLNFGIVDTFVSKLTPYDLNKDLERIIEANEKIIQKETKKALKSVNLPVSLSGVDPKYVDDKLKASIKKIEDEVRNKYRLNESQIIKDLKKKKVKKDKERQETIKFLEGIQFLCLEEAHDVSGNGYYSISKRCKNAHYRLALTATPFMKDDEEANMTLMAASGVVAIKVSEKMLIDRGILATPYFKFIKPNPPKKLRRSTKWQAAYQIGVIENEDRNKAIVREIQDSMRYSLTTMVLISRQAHGEHLRDLLQANGVRVRFIYGKHEQTQRKEALDELGAGKIDCLIGSTILDVGVDVPSVGKIVLAGGGKAEVQHRQRIGRGLRAKKDGPNVCFVVDFDDPVNKILARHSKERRAIVEKTEGFAEHIVPRFEYLKLGFVKK